MGHIYHSPHIRYYLGVVSYHWNVRVGAYICPRELLYLHSILLVNLYIGKGIQICIDLYRETFILQNLFISSYSFDL